MYKCEREAKISEVYIQLIIFNILGCWRLRLVGNFVRKKNSPRIFVGNSYETVTWKCIKMEEDETGMLRENGD